MCMHSNGQFKSYFLFIILGKHDVVPGFLLHELLYTKNALKVEAVLEGI